MNYLAFAGMVNFLSSLFCSGLVYLRGSKKLLNISWTLHSFFVALWAFAFYKAFSANTEPAALFWARSLNSVAIFIPVFFYFFALCLFWGVGFENSRKKSLNTRKGGTTE